jgi:hypothetical protein
MTGSGSIESAIRIREDMRVTERFRRVDFGHMQFQVTFDDPQT